MKFNDLPIIPPIQRALTDERYSKPTPIQEQAIPPIMAGRDVLGCAQTGTGKTAAFAIPILQRLYEEDQANGPRKSMRRIRSLILSPTRELALQIYESFRAYGRYTGLRCCVIFGGVSQRPQEITLKKGVDILIATPGRLEDLMSQRLIDLKHVEVLTLDEADMMLDMGFIHAVKRIIGQTPEQRQTLLFSATMPQGIVEISRAILNDPVKITITPETPAVEAIDQCVYFVDKMNKRNLLLHLLKDPTITSALVFTRTKHGADRVVRQLRTGGIRSEAIHGNKSQNARQKALKDFKNKITRVLVATDVAARGLDIDDLSHVINFELPEVPETYVHRIGRTGRAGHSGSAIAFCDIEEKKLLKGIENLCGISIPRVEDHPYPMRVMHAPPKQPRPARGSQNAASRHGSGRQRPFDAGNRTSSAQRNSKGGGGTSQKPYKASGQRNAGGSNRQNTRSASARSTGHGQG